MPLSSTNLPPHQTGERKKANQEINQYIGNPSTIDKNTTDAIEKQQEAGASTIENQFGEVSAIEKQRNDLSAIENQQQDNAIERQYFNVEEDTQNTLEKHPNPVALDKNYFYDTTPIGNQDPSTIENPPKSDEKLSQPVAGGTNLAAIVKGPTPAAAQGWKFISYSHCQGLCQKAGRLLIGYTRVNNQSEARSAS